MSQRAAYIRKYTSETEFLTDAGDHIQRGYQIASQSWEQGGPSVAGKVILGVAGIFVLLALLSLFVPGQELAFVPAFFVALVMLAIGSRERARVLSVTNQVTKSTNGLGPSI